MIGVCVQGLLADRYELQELLGRGAMGEVWRACDHLLGRPVAVKLLHAEEAADAERFRLEAQIAARLNHPNVVGMYDFGAHHHQPHLVMELVDGWNLAQERSLRGALPPAEAAAITAQAAAGLAAAHQQAVVHRDVKPANVMLTTDRTVKITDFGIARFAEETASNLTATGKIIGTADYLAPERALGRPAQPASDVYSLGCVLYELLTGRPPFSGATSLAVVQQHVSATPAPPYRLRPGIPQPLSDYVLLMLAKDPAHRRTGSRLARRAGRDTTTGRTRQHHPHAHAGNSTASSGSARRCIPRRHALPSQRSPQTGRQDSSRRGRPRPVRRGHGLRSLAQFRCHGADFSCPSLTHSHRTDTRRTDPGHDAIADGSDHHHATQAGARRRQGWPVVGQARRRERRKRTATALRRLSRWEMRRTAVRQAEAPRFAGVRTAVKNRGYSSAQLVALRI
jgi:serine/threonine-protein kinase